MADGIPARLSPAENRKFALTVGVAFAILGGVLWYRGRLTGAAVAAGLGSMLILAGVVLPARLGPVHRGWLMLAKAISAVTTPVFLGVVYFLLFVPVGAVLRLAGRDPLATRGPESLWHPRTGAGRRGDLTRQF